MMKMRSNADGWRERWATCRPPAQSWNPHQKQVGGCLRTACHRPCIHFISIQGDKTNHEAGQPGVDSSSLRKGKLCPLDASRRLLWGAGTYCYQNLRAHHWKGNFQGSWNWGGREGAVGNSHMWGGGGGGSKPPRAVFPLRPAPGLIPPSVGKILLVGSSVFLWGKF